MVRECTALKVGDLVRHRALGGDHMGIVMIDRVNSSRSDGTSFQKYHIHWLVLPARCSHLLKWQPIDSLEKLNENRI